MGPRRFYHRKVVTDERTRPLPVKDLVVLIPLFATALAISWEVGRFQPSGGFLFFSLSEHILAAMEALPHAMASSAYFVVLIIIFTNFQNRPAGAQSRADRLVKWAVVISAGAAGAMLYMVFPEAAAPAAVLSNAFKSGLVYHHAFFNFGMALTVAIVVANAFWFRRPWASPVMLSLLGAASIILAMMAGINQSLALIHYAKSGKSVPYNAIATIVSKNDSSKGYVLMMGERGLLTYFPDSDRFSFQKANEIQKIEWQAGWPYLH